MKINQLEIFTPNLAAQINFYTQNLGLDIIEQNDNFATFKVGYSKLKITYRANFSPYHFAINIPSNQAEKALNWLKNKVEILKDEGSEIQYFDFWEANAIYFYDADNNIVEFIARKRLNQISNQPFDKNSLIAISEIGIPTADISRVHKILNEATNIPIYSGSLERFCAIGDDNGLFIVINKMLKKEWFPTNDQPFSADFNIKFIEQDKIFILEYFKDKLILAQP